MTVAYPDTEMPSPIGSVIEVTPPPRGSVSGGSSKDERKRTHVCPTCQRAFGRLEHLTRHERSHTREKPFECFECSRRFARRYVPLSLGSSELETFCLNCTDLV